NHLVLTGPRSIIRGVSIEVKSPVAVGDAVRRLAVPAHGKKLHPCTVKRLTIQRDGSSDFSQLVATARSVQDQESSEHKPNQSPDRSCNGSFHLNNLRRPARHCGSPSTGRSGG